MIEIKTETYGCECGYTMDKPTYDNAAYFAKKGLVQGRCPSCKQHQLSQIVDLAKLSTHKVVSDDILDEEMVEELDANGQPVMIQTGERYELRVNPDTGDIYSEAVPIYEPKMIPAPKQQVDELKLQRDQSLDALESVAVKEVSK